MGFKTIDAIDPRPLCRVSGAIDNGTRMCRMRQFQSYRTKEMVMEMCPCGSGNEYMQCCRPYIQGAQSAPTAEALMRSRYSAYVTSEIDYVHQTTHPTQRSKFNHKESLEWSRKADWKSLEIIRTDSGGPEDSTGTVEFVAHYYEKGKAVRHHEIAEFRKEDGILLRQQ